VARRLFGIGGEAAMPGRSMAGWNWLAPLAGCALTMLVVMHTATLATTPLASQTNSGSLFTIMLTAADSSNLATFTLSQLDENMEYNVWSHASHHIPVVFRPESRPQPDR
jgi:hypothetical protein